MISFWEQQSFMQYDCIIIGAGIVGLSTALEYRQLYPSASILIVDRGFIPTGASTRNAGFACMGSLSELVEDAKTLDKQQLLQLFAWRKEGLQMLRNRLGDEVINYQEHGSHEFLLKNELHLLQELNTYNDLLYDACGYKVFEEVSTDVITANGMQPHIWSAAVKVHGEGMLHTGKMIQALLQLCRAKNIEIRTGTEAHAIEEEENNAVVIVPDELRQAQWHLKAQQVFICTNAFTQTLLPQAAVTPGRGQVLVTSPIKDLKLKGIFHFDQGYYYFRELDGRVLLGGARNLAVEDETTLAFGAHPLIISDLKQKLKEWILPGKEFTIDYQWSGIMAFGVGKFPVIEQVSAHVAAAYKMGGMGVALGSKVAQQLVNRTFK